MKKINLVVTLIVLFLLSGYSENTPQGINYQGVAHDLNGNVIKNKPLTLKIALVNPLNKKGNYYTELHQVITNNYGLFTLVIGTGKAESGVFTDIPWSKEEIWIDVAMKSDGEKDFKSLGSSKLYTVPYAFYAGTAGAVTKTAESASEKKTQNFDKCQCNGGLKSITFLYLGPANVTINVYDNQNLNANSLLSTFSAVTNGAILTLNATTSPNTLKEKLYFQYVFPVGGPVAVGIPVQEVPAECKKYDNNYLPSPGSTFGNISIISQTDKYGSTCTACDVYGDWSIGGNAVLDACNKIGTLTNTDFVVITNNIEQMRVKNGGDISIVNNVSIGKNLEVAGLTKANNVVNSFTPLDGSLTTAGGAGIAKNLNVGGAFNAAGSVSVGGVLNITDTTQSTSTTTGALIVAGGVGIGKQLNVGGITNINNNLNVTTNNTGSVATFVNTNNGNGDGITIKLGKKATKNNTAAQVADNVLQLYVDNGLTAATLSNLLAFLDNNPGNDPDIISLLLPAVDPADALKLAQATAATACQLGASVTNQIVDLINSTIDINLAAPINSGIGLPIDIGARVNSGIGLPWNLSTPINDALHLPLHLHVGLPDPIPNIDIDLLPALPLIQIPGIPANTLVIPRIPDFTLPAIPHIPNICADLGPGINLGRFVLSDVYVTNPLNEENHFVTFADNTDFQLGAIKAQSIEDWATSYLNAVYFYKLYSDFSGLDRSKVFAQMKAESKELASAYIQIGVEYSSGNGDYAEWLERLIPNEDINAGDIVAVKSGKITKDLSEAEQIMAVSNHPIVLGNTPPDGRKYLGNNIAFMGQIPVKIMGPVTSGDYIVGKGDISGYGIAVSPANMTIEDYKLAVGRSWETNLNNGPKMINTIVGVHNGDFIKILKKYEEKFKESESRMTSIEEKLEKISDALPKTYTVIKK